MTALALEGIVPRPTCPAGDLASPLLPPEDAAVLEAVDWSATSTETVLIRTGRCPAEVATILSRLEMGGWLRGQGGWWERRR